MTKNQQATIRRAIRILDSFLKENSVSFNSPGLVRDYLRLRLERAEREIFAVLYVDSQHRLIEYVELFYGTINASPVYPRVVAQKALKINAFACFVVHNHPSGTSDPSHADIKVTERLKSALELIDIPLLDHFVVGKNEITSFAERGLI